MGNVRKNGDYKRGNKSHKKYNKMPSSTFLQNINMKF